MRLREELERFFAALAIAGLLSEEACDRNPAEIVEEYTWRANVPRGEPEEAHELIAPDEHGFAEVAVAIPHWIDPESVQRPQRSPGCMCHGWFWVQQRLSLA